MIIGGFKRDTPRDLLKEAWAGQLLPEVSKHIALKGFEVFCPYMLSLVLFARCPSAVAARNLVSVIRRLKLRAKVNEATYDVWGTLKKPKEIKMRNRRLIKLAEYLAPDMEQQENWKRVCWRTGTLILEDKRVCRVSHSGPRVSASSSTTARPSGRRQRPWRRGRTRS